MPPSQRDIEVHKETERRIAAMHIEERHSSNCPWRMARELVGEASA